MSHTDRHETAFSLGFADAWNERGYGCWPLDYDDAEVESYDNGYGAGVAARDPKLARKPQDFDTSPLPLFGDSHKQRELF